MALSKKAPLRAQVALRPLKNCLVNLPGELVELLLDNNTVRQMYLPIFFTNGILADPECCYRIAVPSEGCRRLSPR